MGLTSIHHDLQNDTRAATQVHVAHPQQGDEARAEGAAVVVESWVSLQIERQECAWKAGYRAANLQDGDIC